ncbi:MAG TPA: periplasmic heavy metal sensor [Casimicrobiaceae bacterium]|nr:periplasmic heavy metal sensor [Casimicrobiaceae bacterium]
MKKHRTSNLVALAAATLLGLTGMVAVAQPMGGPGGPHGPRGGMEIEHVLLGVKSQLALNTSQQLSWDNAVAQTRAAHDAARANGLKLHDAMSAELAKPEPDLAAMAALADGIHATNLSLRQKVRTQWLQLYATFSPEQKAVVRDAMSKQMARMESFGARMREHMQRGG